MNKKLMVFGLLGIFALTIISAVVMPYLFSRNTTVDTEQTLTGLGLETETVPCNAGESCLGSSIIISSIANRDRTIEITTEKETGIGVNYVGTLFLTKKDTTTWVPTSEKIEITYTIVGDTFEATGDLPTGYVLVYAMDKENRFNDYATVIRVEDVDESLPMTGDWNANANPDYCNNNNGFDSYAHCVGAKIWAIPESAIGVLSGDGISYKLTWAGMTNYYWETDLIYYFANADGEITVPANSFIEFYPQYVISPMIDDTEDYELTTEIIALN